jgi:hypothetical protein
MARSSLNKRARFAGSNLCTLSIFASHIDHKQVQEFLESAARCGSEEQSIAAVL